MTETVIKRWVIVHEPGKIPQKKTPHPNTDEGVLDFLIQLELCRVDGTGYTVIEYTWDQDIWVSSGREMLDEARLMQPRIFARRVRALAAQHSGWLAAAPDRVKSVALGRHP